MDYCLDKAGFNQVLQALSQENVVYAPKLFKDGGSFSDRDRICYGEIHTVEEIIFDRKSEYSFKEVLKNETRVRIPDGITLDVMHSRRQGTYWIYCGQNWF